MVLALAKIHNYCIDQNNTNIFPMTAADELRLMSNGIGSVAIDESTGSDDGNDEGIGIPRQLIGAGDHFEDVPREVRDFRRRTYNDTRLPRERLAEDFVTKTERENNMTGNRIHSRLLRNQ